MLMKVVLIGSGNVATILGRLIADAGHEVIQVMSRNIEHAKELGELLGTVYTDYTQPVNMNGDIVIIAVSDSGIQNLVPVIADKHKLVLHTAGSVSKDVLKQFSDNYGVLYPLQSLRKELNTIPRIPFLVDGSDEGCTRFIEDFAGSFSTNVQRATDEERLKLHAAAVIVSNFTNHLYAIAEEFCVKEKVDFNLLKPLIVETAHRIENASPAEVQTGPAMRKDIHTLDKHLRLLTNHPKLRTTYLRLTDSIMNP
jgi:predicted short-subunit dehydrogenase-like oxidoreductase (DUF2520 family)